MSLSLPILSQQYIFWVLESIGLPNAHLSEYHIEYLIHMLEPDNLSAGQVQRSLETTEFSLTKNMKANHEVWETDFSLIGVEGPDEEEDSKILDV